MLDILSEVELFRSVPSEGLTALATGGDKRVFRARSQLMRQGDRGHSLFIIVKGRVRLERSHPALVVPIDLDELGPGEIVGDVGLLDGKPISDTVTAIDDTETVELGAAALAHIVLRFPETWSTLLPALSQRLRSADELAEQLAREGADSRPSVAPPRP